MTLKNDRPFQRVPVQKMTLEIADEDYSHIDYWLSRPVSERLEALELLRQIVYGYDPETARLTGPVEVIELEWGQAPGTEGESHTSSETHEEQSTETSDEIQ